GHVGGIGAAVVLDRDAVDDRGTRDRLRLVAGQFAHRVLEHAVGLGHHDVGDRDLVGVVGGVGAVVRGIAGLGVGGIREHVLDEVRIFGVARIVGEDRTQRAGGRGGGGVGLVGVGAVRGT